MKIGLIDVGGGERGVYGAGVLDRCLEEGISFDYHIGVSAGAANIASFLAGQKGRNLRFYTEYSFRPQYMGVRTLLRTGSYVDLEYIYGAALTNAGGENPLDFAAMRASGKEMEIVATDADTAEPVYYTMADMAQDDYGAIKGSSCLPVIARPYRWKGRLLYDGGVSDPIPVRRAFERGCGRAVLILTRPRGSVRDPARDAFFARLLSLRRPAAGRALAARAATYNRQLELAKEYERQGRLLIVAPDDIGGMKTLTRDVREIRLMYEKGRRDAEAIRSFLS